MFVMYKIMALRRAYRVMVYLACLVLFPVAPTLAEDSPSLTRIKGVAERLNAHRTVSKIYSIDNLSTTSLGSTYVWRRDAAGVGVALECRISLNQARLDMLKLNDNAIAWIIGHEMGHCESGTDKIHVANVIPADAWLDEYKADEIGKDLMQAAGYMYGKGGSAAVAALNKDDNPSHPGSLRRLGNLAGEGGLRESPVAVRSGSSMFIPRLRQSNTLSVSAD